MPNSLLALGDEDFIVLTTFRKTGVAVPTTVWVARDGDALLVITPSESGKVKRIRNSGRVEVQASGRMGKVKPGATILPGTAVIIGDAPSHPDLLEIFVKKYGFQWHLTMLIERIAARRQKPRLLVRITPV
jgi:PPOX class probable F420-dependent enzyme